MLTLQIKEKEIENLTPEEEFVRGTVGAKCQINFDEFWQSYNKYIVFKRVGYEPINFMVDTLENEIEIPYTILAESGEFKIGVFGITETETLPTLYSKDIKILYGTDTHGTTPPTYIPSEIDQLRLSKQDKLVSGENIKTVNGESVLGSGNIKIQVEVDQTYTPDSTNAQSGKAVTEALSGYVVAEVGKGLSSNDFTNEDKEKLYSALQNENIDKTYNPTSENAQSGKAVAEAVLNEIKNDEFFLIDDEGIISLKPIYRGACPSNRSSFTFAISDKGIAQNGSKNSELPEILYIPHIIDEKVATSLADGMFLFNKGIKTIVIPKEFTKIPQRFCDNSSVIECYGTENVTNIGASAFQSTHIKKALFPKLKAFDGAGVFNQCDELIYADIGDVTSIPLQSFYVCEKLNVVKGGTSVTTIGKKAFSHTIRLRSVDFMESVTSIGDRGFLGSRLKYDWWNATGKTYGTYASALQLNPTNYGANVVVSGEHINPLPTVFCQKDPRWANTYIGATVGKPTNILYKSGCYFLCMAEIHCAIMGKSFSTIAELEAYIDQRYPSIWSHVSNDERNITSFAAAFDMTATKYYEYTQANYQTLLNSLAAGKYAMVAIPSTGSSEASLYGHGVVAYGVKANKEVCLSSSDRAVPSPFSYENFKYSIVLPNCCRFKSPTQGASDEATNPFQAFTIIEPQEL